MAALDHCWNIDVALVTDGELDHEENVCRYQHRRVLPADQGENPCPQLRSDSVQSRIPKCVPPEGGEIGRPRAATCVPDVHNGDHLAVTDQDVAGSREIGMDHVRCLSWWWDGGTHEAQAVDQGR